MTLQDLFALAKQGYKPQDVKELIALAAEVETAQAATPDDDSQPAEDKKDESEKPDEKQPAKATENEPDYKALYEKSQEDLKKAQAFNVNQNREKEPEKSSDELLLEMMEKIL